MHTFDAAGNRLTRTGSGTGHEAFGAVGGQTQYNDLNQMRHYAYGATTWVENAYDNNGALVRRRDRVAPVAFGWNYTWSADGYMTRAEDVTGGTDIKYAYDWRGRRLEREDETNSANGPKRRYYFWGLTPIAERTGSYGLGYGWSDDVYNTLTGGDLGQVLWRRTGGGTDRALHYDHIGNVVAESNTSGAMTATHEQDAYGRAVLGSAADG